LIHAVFSAAARLMEPGAVIYVRTDAREFTRGVTTEALIAAFPNKRLEVRLTPYDSETQTALFGDHSPKPGEVDLILI
jgi:tRNA G46 methylase TrmB